MTRGFTAGTKRPARLIASPAVIVRIFARDRSAKLGSPQAWRSDSKSFAATIRLGCRAASTAFARCSSEVAAWRRNVAWSSARAWRAERANRADESTSCVLRWVLASRVKRQPVSHPKRVRWLLGGP